MSWTSAEDEKPKSGVDVYVVTEDGEKGVAKFWDVTSNWLTADPNIGGSTVLKWKYAQAVNLAESCKHKWVDATNKVVTGGLVCTECHAIKTE